MITLKRWYKSIRKLFNSISLNKSLLVAAMIRTSTGISFSPPTLVILFSCNARNTFDCADKLISPISSRNKVPPLACSNFPMRCFIAEVKEPFSCPNNSDSINSEGIAAQFTSIKGPFARLLFSCIQRATNSLPLPFSPVINTRASVGATFSMVSLIRIIGDDCPMILRVLETLRFNIFVSVMSSFFSSALRTLISKRFKSGGF